MPGLTLGIDLGTTNTKLALVDPERGVLAQTEAEAGSTTLRPGWSEADPRVWWTNVCTLVPKVLDLAGVAATEVAAVATTGMVPAVIAVDAEGAPLRAAILQNDSRAGHQVADLTGRLTAAGFDPVAETGSAITQQSVAPTLMWLAEHEPEVSRRAAQVLGSYDWLAFALGAEMHLERNWALESGLYPVGGSQAIPAVLEAAGMDSRMLAPVKAPGTVVGAVSHLAAAETGLNPGTMIVVGGADHVLSAFAAGLSAPGKWMVKLGSAGDILAVTTTPTVDPRIYLDAHPAPGLWLPNGCMATSGSALAWLRTEILREPSVAQLEAEAAEAAPAEAFFLPYLLGEKSPWHDADLRGAFLGLHRGLGRGAVYRAVLEGVAYGFRHHTEVFNELGIALEPQAAVTNGGSRSRVWKQILADALGVPLIPIENHPGASLGAALAAAVGAGLLNGWDEAGHLVSTGEPVVPDPALAGRYGEGYAIYRAAADALAPISHLIARRSPLT